MSNNNVKNNGNRVRVNQNKRKAAWPYSIKDETLGYGDVPLSEHLYHTHLELFMCQGGKEAVCQEVYEQIVEDKIFINELSRKLAL